MFSNYLLSLAIWIPIAAGVLVLATGPDSRAPLARVLALIGALAGFLVTLPLFTGFDSLSGGYQFTEFHEWIPLLRINYSLGVDGISVLFVILNAFITLMVVLAGWEVIQKRPAQYMAAFLIMSGLINGAFSARDALLFYVFFEGMLIPLYLIIGVWGGPRRVYASVKLFLYTLMGSLLMLVAIVYLSYQAGGFSIEDFQNIKQIPLGVQQLLFVAFFLSFAVKVPMFPVHTWLPDAHVEAPTGGSMVLAGDYAETRRIRLFALHPADSARCVALFRAGHHRVEPDCGGVYRHGRAGADRYEKTGGVFIHQPYGFRYLGDVLVH